MYVRRNMAAQYAATKAINYPARSKVLRRCNARKMACVRVAITEGLRSQPFDDLNRPGHLVILPLGQSVR
jgi:hypothetical protein